jgi:hypothetical protein
MTITYSESISVALGIQRVQRMRRIVLCGLPRSTLLFHISHKRHNFVKELMCVLILSTILPAIFRIIRGSERAVTVNVCRSSCNILVLLRYSTNVRTEYFKHAA